MGTSASEQCRACIEILKTIIMTLSKSEEQKGYIRQDTVDDELERFSLWIGNIGALHQPASSLSLESRLREAKDILAHILEILEDLNEVAKERESAAWSTIIGVEFSRPFSEPFRPND